MDEVKRMGRPPKAEADKRQQIAVRTSLQLKEHLQEAADRSGRSLAQEAELRLEQSVERDQLAGSPETARLLAMLASEIAVIERDFSARWHEDYIAWAAVAEMMHHGPIRQLRPYRVAEDAEVKEAFARLHEVREQKSPFIETLRSHGLHVEDMPQAKKGRMFGGGEDRERIGLLRMIEVLPDIEEKSRNGLRQIVSILVDLDQKEREALEVYSQAIAPFIQDEEKGRAAYRAIRRRTMKELVQRGELDSALQMVL